MNTVETHVLSEVFILTSGISTFGAFALPQAEPALHNSQGDRRTKLAPSLLYRYFEFLIST